MTKEAREELERQHRQVDAIVAEVIALTRKNMEAQETLLRRYQEAASG